MAITRRGFGFAAAGGIGVAALPRGLRAGEVHRSHGESLVSDELKYPPGFAHFEHSNPDAPKGGTMRLAAAQNFDSFNPYIVKGTPPLGIGLIYDTLMTRSLDEGSTMYGLLAEWIEHPADQAWAAFRLRDEARWHDGAPVTVEDVIFSLKTLQEKGAPHFGFYYANVVEARDMGDRVVRFDFDQTGNRELPHIMGQLPILPRHWWEGRDFAESSLERPLASGPYRVGDFEVARFVEYERVPDYWGADLGVYRGAWNFDRIRYEVFLDQSAAFDAFRAGQVDFREENSAINWAQKYDFPAVRDGRIRKEEITLEGPKSIQGFAMNLRREKFRDRRVRQALALAFDFEWANETVFFGQYAQPRSYFQYAGESDLMPVAPPGPLELELLEPLRDQVPEEVFGEPFTPPETDGSGRNRRNLRRAAQLLAEAGWTVRDNVLVDAQGRPFTLEFLSASDQQGRIVLPYLANLEKLGIQGEFRVVDPPQFFQRVYQSEDFDFDMIIDGVANSESPGNEQREYWGSASAMRPGTRNLVGLQDPAVDTLIEAIIFAPDRERLAAASRALDRVLTWSYLHVMELYTPFERIAYWDRFDHPRPLSPLYVAERERWWFDVAKDAALGDRG